MRFVTCLVDQHDLLLVALAAIICLAGTAITIKLFQKLRTADADARMAWLFLGSVATGATIWCTHFVAMIAYRPGVRVAYEPLLTGASLALAIAGSAVAMAVAARKFRYSAEIGGAILGLAICGMHYTGMAAFTVKAFLQWSPGYVAVSVVAAVVCGALSFNRATRSSTKLNFGSAVGLLVLGIVALHFSGMAALTIYPLAPETGDLTGGAAAQFMAIAVTGVCLLVLGTGAASHALDLQSSKLAHGRLTEIVEGSVDGMVVEADGHIIAVNNAFAELIGVDHALLIGQSLQTWIADLATLPHNALSQTQIKGAADVLIPVEIAVRQDVHIAHDGARRIYAVRDLRTRLAQERRIAHLARNDSLTGLPNRASFLEYLAVQTRKDAGRSSIALLALDLDRFKEVNDVHGHAPPGLVVTNSWP